MRFLAHARISGIDQFVDRVKNLFGIFGFLIGYGDDLPNDCNEIILRQKELAATPNPLFHGQPLTAKRSLRAS